MTELHKIENRQGRFLTLTEFLELEYHLNLGTVKQDLAYIVNNFHNLVDQYNIEPSKTDKYGIDYVTKSDEGRVNKLRTPVPLKEGLLTEHDINPMNTLATTEEGNITDLIQPCFLAHRAPEYLEVAQRVISESLDIDTTHHEHD
jgi:hypothetical protein